MTSDLFSIIAEAVNRPEVDSNQSTRELWTDAYVAEQMLRFHLDPESDAASYRHAVIERAVDWLYRHFSLSGESAGSTTEAGRLMRRTQQALKAADADTLSWQYMLPRTQAG